MHQGASRLLLVKHLFEKLTSDLRRVDLVLGRKRLIELSWDRTLVRPKCRDNSIAPQKDQVSAHPEELHNQAERPFLFLLATLHRQGDDPIPPRLFDIDDPPCPQVFAQQHRE